MEKGIHLIGDLHDCDFHKVLETEEGVEKLKRVVSDKIEEVGLTELDSYYHFFSPFAVTCVICLSESHVTFHTWSEEKYANMDVFVCNHSEDNSYKARQLFKFLVKDIFKPGRIKAGEITR